jgi:putative DNA primase/helicase
MSKPTTPEEAAALAKKRDRAAFISDLTNRQRLADGFHKLFHSQGRRFVYWRKQWWQWTGDHYKPLDPEYLESVLVRYLEAELLKAGPNRLNLTRTLRRDVFELLQSRCKADSDREAPFSVVGHGLGQTQHISLANGVLDVDAALSCADALFQHDPEWFSLAALPFPYRPEMLCRGWDRFLLETFEGDLERVDFIEEWLGYCCVYDYSHQHAVILAGEGANGKGVLTKLAIALLGEDNVSHVPLELFGRRFQLVPTIGKLLNTAPEISSIDKGAEEQLKAVTGGDRLTIDVKYQTAVQVKLTARLMFSTNEIPTFFDRSGGLKRRLIIVPFNRQVPENEQNPKLPDELMPELPGIFNRCLSGLRRLKSRGHFLIPGVSKDAVASHMLTSNPAATFLGECVTLDPAVATFSLSLFEEYTRWFQQHGYPKSMYLAQPQFAGEVKRVFKVQATQGTTRAEKRRRYVGLRTEGGEMVTA